MMSIPSLSFHRQDSAKSCLRLRAASLWGVFLLGPAASAPAALLVYEGFKGYDTSNNSLILQAPNSHTQGLGSDLYALGAASSGVAFTPLATGLEFGSLKTAGGALGFTPTATSVASTKLSSELPAWTLGQSLYSSYLVHLTSTSVSGTNGLGIRITSQDATPSGSPSDARFNSFAVGRAEAPYEGLAVSYDNTWNQSSSGDGNILDVSQTYFILSRFTQVGTALSPQNPGKGEIWALNSDQFESFATNGRQESWLANPSHYSAYSFETMSSGTFDFSGNAYLQLLSIGQTGTLDEIRFGTSLWDVTPLQIPEPSTVGLLLAGVFGLTWRRSRNSA